MRDLRRKTLSGLNWSAAGQSFQQLAAVLFSIFLARILTPNDFGLLAMVFVFSGFATLLSELGLGAALVQREQIEHRHINAAFWANLAAGAVLALVFLALAPALASFYSHPALEAISRAVALLFIVSALGVVQGALVQREMSFRRLAFIEIAATVIAGCVAVALAASGYGVWSLVAQLLCGQTLRTTMLWWVSAWRPTLTLDRSSLRELWGFSSHLMGFNVFNYWIRNLDNLLIGRFVGASDLGVYSRAYSLMLLPVSQASRVTSRVMFPALSRIRTDIERSKSLYLKATRSIALVMFPIMIGLLVVAESFVLAVLGEKWRAVVPLLQLFCLIGVGQSVGTTAGWIYTSQGRTDLMMKWGIFAGLVQAASFVVGLNWGVMGVAAAYVIASYTILWYPAWAIPGRLINLTFGQMMRNLAGPFVCSALMGVAVWTIGAVLLGGWSPWGKLAVQVPFGLVVYVLCVHMLRVQSYVELRETIREGW